MRIATAFRLREVPVGNQAIKTQNEGPGFTSVCPHSRAIGLFWSKKQPYIYDPPRSDVNRNKVRGSRDCFFVVNGHNELDVPPTRPVHGVACSVDLGLCWEATWCHLRLKLFQDLLE